MERVELIEGDLLDQDVDVIVNAWNRNIIPWWLLLPQGVSGAIKRRGGTSPFKEVRRHGSIPLGGAVLTSAGACRSEESFMSLESICCGGHRSARSVTR